MYILQMGLIPSNRNRILEKRALATGLAAWTYIRNKTREEHKEHFWQEKNNWIDQNC